MKKIFIIFILLSFIYIFSGEITGIIDFSMSDITLKNDGEYIVPKIEGCSYPYNSEQSLGTPKLPVKVLNFVIPSDAEVVSVEYNVVSIFKLGEYNIKPIQRARPIMMMNRGDEFPFVEMKKELYDMKSNYPEIKVKKGHEGYKNGWQLVSIEIYPMEYNVTTKELYLNNEIEYKIVYEENKKAGKSINEKIKSQVEDNIKNLVENPEMVEKFAPTTYKLTSDSIDYVIITDAAWVSNVEPLREWKTKKGKRAITVTVDWITTNYTGTDDPEKIRNFIIDCYNTWGSMYFLLVGQDDSDIDDSGYSESPGTWVPRRDCFCTSSGANYYDDEDTIASDLYYGDLDGTWNSDGDGVWGETGDNVDMYTDVYVGRVLAENSTQVDAYVNRVLNHERNYPTNNMAERILLTSENLFTGYDGAQVSDSLAKYDPAYFTEAKCYDENNAYDDLATIDSMEVGYGYIHHAGHGLEYALMSADYITYGDLDTYLSNNTNLYGIVTAISCWSGAYDYNSYAEHLQVVCATGEGGVSAAMLNYRYGWGLLDDIGRSEYQNIWFMQSVSATGSFTSEAEFLGEALADAKDKAVPYTSSDVIVRWCIYEYNLYGDPELPLWTENPKSMSVTYPSEIYVGTSSVDISVEDASSSTALSNAYVCLMAVTSTGDTMIYKRGYTDASGNISISINAAEQDTISLVVTKKNYDPFESIIVINPGNSINYYSKTVEDTLTTGTVLADGNINNGETADLDIIIKNTTGSSQTNVTGTIQTSSSYVTILDNTASYGTIADQATATGTYRIALDNNTPDGTTISFDLLVSYGSTTDTSTFSIIVDGVCYASANKSEVVFDYSTKKLNNEKNIVTVIKPHNKVLYKSEIIEPSKISYKSIWDRKLDYKTVTGYDTLMYDDPNDSWTGFSGVNYYAVTFNVASECSVKTVWYGRYNEYDVTDSLFIWEDTSGSPGTLLYSAYWDLTGDDTSAYLYSLAIDGPVVNGNFWVGFYTPTGQVGNGAWAQYAYFEADASDGGTYSYYSSDKVSWNNLADAGYANDLIIRAEVAYFTLASDSGIVYILNTDPSSVVDYNITNITIKNNSTWISGVNPQTGTVPIGDSLGIMIYIDTVGLADGEYVDTMLVYTDADLAKAVTLEIPIRLLLGATGTEMQNLTANIENKDVILNWISNSNRDYSISRSQNPNETNIIANIKGQEGINKYTDSNLNDGIYYYKIGYTSGIGIEWSNTIKININPIETQFNITKSLNNDFVNIKFSISDLSKVRMQVFDITGRSIKTIINREYNRGEYSYNWDLTDNNGNKVQNGMYFIKFTTKQKTINRKLIIVK